MTDMSLTPRLTTLRWFGVFAAGFFAGLAAWRWCVHGDSLLGSASLAVAVIMGFCGLVFPSTLRLVFVAWMTALYPINWLVSTLILAFIFYGIFTPLGLFFALIGRDVLTRRFPGQQDTYWVDKTTPHDVRSYFRQS